MKDLLINILNGEHPEYGIEEVRLNNINATAYFFKFKRGLCSEDTKPYLKCLPESYYDDGFTEWEREVFEPFQSIWLRCCRLIRDNGNFDEIVYYSDGKQMIDGQYKRAFIDRNGYELEFEV